MGSAAPSWATTRAMPGMEPRCSVRGWIDAMGPSCRMRSAVTHGRLRKPFNTTTTKAPDCSGPFLLGDAGLEDHALAGSAVHDHAKGLGELQVADAALFLDRGLLG